MILYNLRSLTPNHYQMAKFDADFNVAAIYNLAPKGTDFTCDCPANNRTVVLKRCKHRRMLPLMLGAVNTDRFYEPEAGRWHQPIAVENPNGVIAEEIEQPVMLATSSYAQQAQVGEANDPSPPPPPSSAPRMRR